MEATLLVGCQIPTDPDGTLDEKTFVMDSYNFMTPTTETETRYYWFQLRNIRPDDEEFVLMEKDEA